MARLVVAAAAAVVVGYFGGPVAGLQTFALVYGVTGFLDPNKRVLGPKLQDLKAPQANYGAPIAYIEGAPRLAGCFIWASDKREVATTETQGGKGGPGVDSTTFTYEIDCGIELAINRCQAIRRVWSNGKLVWSAADDSDSTTLAASQNTTSWRDIRFYSGAPDQLPDPTYEALVGLGNAPAYRGRSVVVIEGLNLGGSGQLPVLTFEVLSEADEDYSVLELARVPQDRSYIGGIPAAGLGDDFEMIVGEYVVVPFFGGSMPTYLVYSVHPDGTSELGSRYDVALGTTYGTGEPNAAATGNSDVSCIVVSDFAAAFAVCMFSDGSHAGPFDILGASGGGSGAQEARFSKVGNAYVFGSSQTGAGLLKKVAHFNGAGALVAVSAPLATYVDSLAISGAFVYALRANVNDLIYVLDLATMTLQGTIPSPLPLGLPTGASIQGDASGGLFYRCPSFGADPTHSGSIWSWDGAAWNELYTNVVDLCTSPGDATSYSQGARGFISQTWDITGFAVFRYLQARVAIVLPTLDQVVRRLCLRTGLLTDADIDVTELAPYTVRAMAVSQVATTRTTIESLMAAYMFEAVESDVIRFVVRGGASALTVPYEDLAAGQDGKGEPLPLRRRNDIELPAFVTVKYANVLNDFQDGAESGDRLVTSSTAVAVIEMPFGFTPQEAKRLADANTMDLAVSLLEMGPIALPRSYSHLEPTDVITVVDILGDSFRARIVKGTIGSGVMAFDLLRDDATVINSAALTDDDYVSSTLIRVLGATDLEVLDIPILRDADNALGPYVAVDSPGLWSGAEIQSSLDDTTYTAVTTLSDKTIIGEATTVLADFAGGNVFDEVSSVTVDVGDDVLFSYSRDDVLAGDGAPYLIGSEIIYARTAALQSPGVYKLTGLLRGLRGTEWAMGSHAVGDLFVLLQVSGMRKLTDTAPALNATRYYKGVTLGKSAAGVAGSPFIDTGVALMPFAPADVAAVPSGVNDITVNWRRRSRLESSFLSTSVVPLGETTESYEIDVFDGVTLLRTLTATTPTVTYTDAMQAADGVSGSTSLDFLVYQMSASVGRGYPGSTSGTGRHAPLPQISTVTVGGVFASGAPLYVVLGSTRFNYTSVGGDLTLSGIAANLAAVIDADANHTATALAGVITITGPVSLPEPLSVGLDAGDNVLSYAVTQTASPIVAGHREEFNYTVLWADSSVINPLSLLQVVATRISDGMNRNYSGTPTTSSPSFATPTLLDSIHTAFVASGDRAAFDLDNARIDDITSRFYTPLADPLNWTIALYSSDPNMILGSASRGVGLADIPVARPQISTITLSGTPVSGRIYRATLGGVNYDYTAGGGDTTMTLVAAGLAPVIDAAAAYIAGNVGPVITVTGAVANVPFTYAGQVIVSTVTLTGTITQTAA